MRLSRLRAAALSATTVLALLGIATPPAHAVLDACIADVSISTLALGEFNARVTASLSGSCPQVGHRDEITCTVYLVGAIGILAFESTVGTTTDGCPATQVTMTNGLQKTPYIAIGTVEWHTDYLPGVDVAVAVP